MPQLFSTTQCDLEGRGWQVKCHKVLTDNQLFFLKKCFSPSYKHLGNLQCSKKVIFDIFFFCQFCHHFYEREFSKVFAILLQSPSYPLLGLFLGIAYHCLGTLRYFLTSYLKSQWGDFALRITIILSKTCRVVGSSTWEYKICVYS